MATTNSTFVLTNDALSKILDSFQSDGRFVFIHSFRVSSTTGDLASTRSLSNINSTWFTGNISSRVNAYPNHLTTICTVPQDGAGIIEDVKEIYIIGADNSGFTSNLSVLANGAATASTGTANNAFDNSGASTWTASTAANEWAKFNFTHPKIITKLGINPAVNGTSNVIVNDFTIAGSNNDTDWTVLYTGNLSDSNNEQNFTFGNSTAYQYYRISFVLSRNGSDALALKDIKLYESLNQQLFLFALGRPSTTTQFVPGSALSFRVQFDMIQNQNTVTHTYTQATEITEHDSSPYAHPDITATLHEFGANVLPYQNAYVGQYFDGVPLWSVTNTPADDELVYMYTDGKYKQAKSDGTSAAKVVGIAKRPSSVSWAANTAKTVGAYVTPTNTNGHVYECISAGTTGASSANEPCSGTGATVIISVDINGAITGISSAVGGSGYKVGQVLKINGGIGGEITILTLSGTAVATYDNGTLVSGSGYSAGTVATTPKNAWPVIVNRVVQDGSVTWVCQSALRERVITSGLVKTFFTSASIGDDLYLSSSTAGAIVTGPTAVKVGRYLGSGLIQLAALGSTIISPTAIYHYNATFSGVTVDGTPVYHNGTDFLKAKSDGTAAQYVVGLADVTNARVCIGGYMEGLTGLFTAGLEYFLSDTTAGALTTTPTKVKIGTAKTTASIFIELDQSTYNAGPIGFPNSAWSGLSTDGWAVYSDGTNYLKAIVNSAIEQNMAGFADYTNGVVYTYGPIVGLVKDESGSADYTGNVGKTYYLSTSVAGRVSTTPSAVKAGIALSTTKFFIDVDSAGAGTNLDVVKELNEYELWRQGTYFSWLVADFFEDVNPPTVASSTGVHSLADSAYTLTANQHVASVNLFDAYSELSAITEAPAHFTIAQNIDHLANWLHLLSVDNWATWQSSIDSEPSVFSSTSDIRMKAVRISGGTGSELTVNGTITGNTDWAWGTGWAYGTNNAAATSVVSGNAMSSSATISLAALKAYAVTYTISNYSGSGTCTSSLGTICGTGVGALRNTNGTFTDYFYSIAGGSTTLSIKGYNSFSGTLDNISVSEVGTGTAVSFSLTTSGGVIQSATVATSGVSGFTIGQTFLIAGGSGGYLQIATLGSNNTPATVAVKKGGTGYSNGTQNGSSSGSLLGWGILYGPDVSSLPYAVSRNFNLSHNYEGTLQASSYVVDGIWMDTACTITQVDLFVATPPTGANCVVELYKNGTATGATSTIVAAASYSTNTPFSGGGINFSIGDRFGLYITTVGSTEPGRAMKTTTHGYRR